MTGAVGERMGGHGVVCSVYTGRSPGQDTMRLFNFPEHVRRSMHTALLAELQHRLDAPAAEQPSGAAQAASEGTNGHPAPGTRWIKMASTPKAAMFSCI